jgi:hypothetical protein
LAAPTGSDPAAPTGSDSAAAIRGGQGRATGGATADDRGRGAVAHGAAATAGRATRSTSDDLRRGASREAVRLGAERNGAGQQRPRHKQLQLQTRRNGAGHGGQTGGDGIGRRDKSGQTERRRLAFQRFHLAFRQAANRWARRRSRRGQQNQVA